MKWSFLGAGVFYGFWHNRTLANQAEVKRFNKEWARKEKLIAEAKEKYAKLNAPKDSSPSGVITDINDPNFDVEKYLNHALKE